MDYVARRSELVDFAVKPADRKYLITEAGRRPAPLPEDPFANVPELELPLLGTLDLGGSTNEELGRITDFDIDDKGRFGFVPCQPNRRSLKVVDQKGSVVADIPLELADGTDSCVLVAWLAEGTWVVAARDSEGDLARPIAVDIDARRVPTFATLEGAYLPSLRGALGRGLLVLHGLPDVLRYLDPHGDELAQLHKDFNDERALFSPGRRCRPSRRRFRRFGCHSTRRPALWLRRQLRIPKGLWPVVQRKLKMLDVAQRLGDLRSPPGNRLESPRGHQKGRHSIRVNEQYRLTFRWEGNHAYEVCCEDYHP